MIMHGAKDNDLLFSSGAVTKPPRAKHLRVRWIIEALLTAIAVVVAGAVIGFGLAAG